MSDRSDAQRLIMCQRKTCHVLALSIVFIVLYVAITITNKYSDIDGRLLAVFIPQSIRQMMSPYKNKSGDLCTFGLLRLAYKERGYFPSAGRWLNTNGTDHYQPEVCRLRYPRMPASFLSQCLAAANLSYVTTMGDSTGGRYNRALLRSSAIKCQPVQNEKLAEDGFLPDKEYFTAHMPPNVSKFVKSKFRFCSGCNSHRDRCVYTHKHKSYAVTFEHIAQTMILDDSLEIVFPSYREASGIVDEVWALTTQELILRYYLQAKPPDVFIVFLPFAHAKTNMRLSRLPMEIRYFKGLLDEYLPKTTKVFFMPTYSEFEAARKAPVWKNRRFEGMLATDKIDKMNHILYQVLEDDLLEEGSRYFGFFDLIRVSADRGNWSIDGVHMTPVWYESVMAMFWETFCNSVLLDQFRSKHLFS